MRDLNFFEPYIDKKDFKFDRKLVYSSIGIFIVLLFFMYSIFNYLIIRQEEKNVASLQSVAEDPQTLEKVEEIKLKEREVGEFRESVEKIILLDKSLDDVDIINKNLLDQINRKMPKGLFISSMTMGIYDVEIVGVSDDKWSIAEFGRGLEEIYDLGDVFVSNISNEDGHYSFNINIIVKDVIVDAEADGEPEEGSEEEPLEESDEEVED